MLLRTELVSDLIPASLLLRTGTAGPAKAPSRHPSRLPSAVVSGPQLLALPPTPVPQPTGFGRKTGSLLIRGTTSKRDPDARG